MANETSLRSYRDYDAYDRDARDREPAAAGRHGGDPLADLARIMGQDDTYSDLLKSIARTRAEPVFEAPAAEAADEQAEADEAYDLPAMPLRGAAAEEGIDWEDLEAELAKHREAAADEDYAEEPIDELRGSHELWHGEAAAHDELDRRLHEEFGRSFAASDDTGRMPAGAYVAAGAGAAVALGAAAYALRPGQQATRQEASAPPSSYAAPAQAAPAASDGRYAYADEADEAPPRRRRAGVTAIAAIVGLAVLGGGGVYGYRAMSGGGGVGGEPRVIRADQSPVRVAAQQAQDPKPVTDRVAQGERVVVREERPVSAREQAAQVQEPPVPARIIPLVPSPDAAARQAVAAAPVAAPAQVPAPAVRAEEPRRVRTVQVGPDGSIMTPSAAPAPRPSETSLSVVPVSNVPAAPPRLAAAESRPAVAPASVGTPMPPPRPVQTIRVARAEPVATTTATSVEPVRAAPPAPTAARPMDLGPQQTASVRAASTASPAPAAASGSGGTFVQISSHQSEAEARSAFAAAQRRFPLLQGQSVNIRSAEIPGRGTWHRVRVGPFSRSEAQSFCEQLRGSGGSCVLN